LPVYIIHILNDNEIVIKYSNLTFKLKNLQMMRQNANCEQNKKTENTKKKEIT